MGNRTTCAVVGGGPAGMVLGLLLARAGVEVTVLEKHADFLRDFRGDTVHPSTLRLLDELGLWDRFDALPQSRIDHLGLPTRDGREVNVVDFRKLRQPHPFVAMVPQWDLLTLLAEAGEDEPTFTLLLEHEVTGLLRSGARTTGVRYSAPSGDGELTAHLTVACDGRFSIVRRDAGLPVRAWPVPFDVLWFRLPCAAAGEYSLGPRTAPGQLMIVIPREGYFQVGDLIPKGGAGDLRTRGLESFRAEVAELIPEGDATVLQSWDQVKLLDVQLNRLKRWYADGLLCIGDAAHAMSPMGGVGINLAVQDAVGAATLLAEPLLAKRVTDRDLAAVQRRRTPATVITQAVQRVLHARLVVPTLKGGDPRPPAAVVPLLRALPWLPRIPARLLGVGVRPERAPAFARR